MLRKLQATHLVAIVLFAGSSCCAQTLNVSPSTRLQLPSLTEGGAAKNSLNELLQTLPASNSKIRLAVDLNELAAVSEANKLQKQEFIVRAQRAKIAVINARERAGSKSELAILDALGETIRATEKAYYTRELRRNYPPDAYRRIFDISSYAVAVVESGPGRPFCSGTLIAANLVLTAAHCVKGRQVGELEVWRNYVQLSDGSTTAPIRHAVDAVAYTPQSSALDYAVIKLQPASAGSDRVLKFGPDGPCLSTDRVRLRELLYILGHPQQRPLTVHDFAEVLFPYEATRVELEQILTDQRLAKASADTIESIQVSYVQIADGSYLNRSKVWDGKPTLGVLADTFKGNSGAGVYSRNSHRLVGVFVRGQPDYSEAWTPSWQRHEAVLPIGGVIEDLRENSDLLKNGEVCIL